jgi:predicted DsbA family dithiol-disulfide isomerase
MIAQHPRRTTMNGPETRYALEIVSDTICPWCYIGKRRLEAALALIGDEITFDIGWRPFELNPGMPREGLDRNTYRSAKFGSLERSRELDRQVEAAAATVGLAFDFEKMAVTPNTLASHVLVQVAAEAGRQDDAVEALFKAYFIDGRDIGDPTVLADIARACGLDRSTVEAALEDDALRAKVEAEAHAFSRGGVSGVPTVILNRFILFSGAQPPDLIAQTLKEAAAHDQVVAAGRTMAASA